MLEEMIEGEYKKLIGKLMGLVGDNPEYLQKIMIELISHLHDWQVRAKHDNEKETMNWLPSAMSYAKFEKEKDFIDRFVLFKKYFFYIDGKLENDCTLVKNRFNELKRYVIENKIHQTYLDGWVGIDEMGKDFIHRIITKER